MMDRRDSLKLLLAASCSSILPPWLSAARQPSASSATSSEGANAYLQSRRENAMQAIAPVFTWLPMGEVKPEGWIKEQITRDLNEGFAGRLDELCHEAASDTFGSHRNSGSTENKSNSAKINWWNGETEGNWRSGFMMMAYLAGDEEAKLKADEYVHHILSSQEKDGYLGVFAPDMRFSAPGDLWTQACLLRGLLAYGELAHDEHVHHAVVRAADLIVSIMGAGKTPLASGPGGYGQSHDLMISDVMETLFNQTGDVKYRDFMLSLYEQMSETARNSDTSLHNLLDLDAGFADHGANTYETIRVPLWLWMATGREDLGQASRNALEKLSRYTEVSGSAVSQEDVARLKPDPQFTEYEYCATKEIQSTLQSALQKTGLPYLGDRVEQIWFNAAQGSRLPDGSAISYLTCDNRFHCDNLSPDGMHPDPQSKFSPTHADVAVCCNPNAANVAPLFVRGMWMRVTDGGLAALLYGPCSVSTTVNGVRVQIDERTSYPFKNGIEITVQAEREIEFPLLLRDPGWSHGTAVTCEGADIRREGGYWIVTRKWRASAIVTLEFRPTVREVAATNGEVALQYGALLFVQRIEERKTVTKTYPVKGFEDTTYLPMPGKYEAFVLPASARWRGFGLKPVYLTQGTNWLRPFDTPVITLQGTLPGKSDRSEIAVTLVPIGNAPILRRATFPIAP
jgi:uncharacterized protein